MVAMALMRTIMMTWIMMLLLRKMTRTDRTTTVMVVAMKTIMNMVIMMMEAPQKEARVSLKQARTIDLGALFVAVFYTGFEMFCGRFISLLTSEAYVHQCRANTAHKTDPKRAPTGICFSNIVADVPEKTPGLF
jgi:predicted component of type VI protein secretion system